MPKIDGETFVPWDHFKTQMDTANHYRDKTTRANLVLHQILGLLKVANEGGQITDTLWAGNHTTLFEFIEHEIEVIEAPQP